MRLSATRLTSIAQAGGGRTLIQRAIAVLRRYGQDAHIYLPGVGMLNGLTAANYLDSAGTTQGTVDQPVGLVLDAAGGVGVELVSNPGPFTSTTGWVSRANATLSTSNGALLATLPATGAARFYIPIPTVSGKTYSVNVAVSSLGAVFNNVHAYSSVGNGLLAISANITNPGTYPVVFVASGATTYIEVGTSGGGVIGEVIGVTLASVREVTGIHASQPTTASKPILRRGAVNLLTYSGDFSNAAWAKSNGATAPSSNQIAITSTGNSGAAQILNSVAIGSTLTAAVSISGTPGAVVRLMIEEQNGAYPSNTLAITLTATPTIYAVSRTTTLFTSLAIIIRESGTATTVTCGGAALFQGTYTPAQIQARGGIPLTTTAPASTALGPYLWDTSGGKTLVATFPAGNESVTVIDAKSTGQVTLTGQNVVGAYNVAKQFGPELVANGNFDANVSGWIADTSGDITFSSVAGAMVVVRGPGATGGRPYQIVTTVVGKSYSLQSACGAVATVFRCGIGIGSFEYFNNISATGAQSGTFVATTTTTYITIWPNSSSTTSTVDNISVREVVSDINGKIIVNGALTAPELALLQGYANKLAGL